MQGLAGHLSDLTMASSQYDILLCSETLFSDMRHVSELLVLGFGRLVFFSKMPRARRRAAFVRDGYGAFRQPKFQCGCCEMLVFRVFGLKQNLYEYSFYRNPDIDVIFLIVYGHHLLPCRLRMSVPLSCLLVI